MHTGEELRCFVGELTYYHFGRPEHWVVLSVHWLNPQYSVLAVVGSWMNAQSP